MAKKVILRGNGSRSRLEWTFQYLDGLVPRANLGIHQKGMYRNSGG